MTGGNAALIEKAQRGDEGALEMLVDENTGLVKSIAVRFAGRGVDYDDLCQIGHIGMIKAIRNFDLERGTAFSTYAVPLIIGEIKRFLRDDGEIKVGRELKRKGALIYAAREKYISEKGEDPNLATLAEICGFTEEEAAESIAATSAVMSLSEQIHEDGTLEDIIGVDFTPEINEKIALKQAIERLLPEEREIIYLRYYKGLTQSETGRVLNMTQVTVSRRETKALQKLRTNLM